MSNKLIIDCGTLQETTAELEVNDLLTQEQLNALQRQNILNQLAHLDQIVPRIIEDIVEQGGFNLHQSKLDVINQKQTLRQQFAELEV